MHILCLLCLCFVFCLFAVLKDGLDMDSRCVDMISLSDIIRFCKPIARSLSPPQALMPALQDIVK